LIFLFPCDPFPYIDWIPPQTCIIKANFNVTMCLFYCAAIHCDYNGFILAACTKKLPLVETFVGEAKVALFVIRLGNSHGNPSIQVEGDYLLTIMAINKCHLFTGWLCASIIKSSINIYFSF
jgi:hypothetical protein